MRRLIEPFRRGRAAGPLPRDATARRLAPLLAASAEALLTLDAAGRITGANAAAAAVLGADPTGHPVGRYLPAWRDAGPEILAALAGRPVELEGARESAEAFPAEACLGLAAAPGEPWAALVRLGDVTARAGRAAELERLALHDALTGLPNRLLLRDRLAHGLLQAERRGQSLALLLLDLDRFKQVNDTLGHQVGDLLLRQVAPRLAEPLRRSDTLARLGGDEFAIVLPPPADPEQAAAVAERLVRAVAEPFAVDGMRLEIGVSVGVALYPEHGADAEELTRRADAAMYAAKRSRCGFALHGAEESEGVLRRRGLRRDLAAAVEGDGLTLLYQPKVRARDGTLAGLEALVAWDHPEHGRLRAPDFLPMAEQTGLVLPLTLAVLNGCLRQQRRWRLAGLGRLPVAVNLTGHWLLDERLPRVLRLALQAWEGRPEELTLEATEGAVMADPARAAAVLGAVTRLGCRVALDDFGTGYSCLAHMQRLPLAELKVDKRFVLGLGGADRGAAAVVRGVVRLAHGLGLTVVAEGVETRAAADWLTALGCDELQGYLFGRPMPADELGDWLADLPPERRRAA